MNNEFQKYFSWIGWLLRKSLIHKRSHNWSDENLHLHSYFLSPHYSRMKTNQTFLWFYSWYGICRVLWPLYLCWLSHHHQLLFTKRCNEMLVAITIQYRHGVSSCQGQMGGATTGAPMCSPAYKVTHECRSGVALPRCSFWWTRQHFTFSELGNVYQIICGWEKLMKI